LYADARAGQGPSTTASGERLLVRTGAFDALLFQCLEDRRVTCAGFGFGGPHPWLHVGYAPDLGRKSGATLIAEWCRDVLQYPDRPRGAGAARALAACGWPAALVWLERRWLALADQNARSGVLLAAGRGRVVHSLGDSRVVEALLGELIGSDNRAAADRFLVRSVGLALANAPHVDLGNEALAPRVLSALRWSDPGAARGAFGSSVEASIFGAAVCSGLRGATPEYLSAMRARLGEPLAADDRSAARERFEIARMLARVPRAEPAPGGVQLSDALLQLLVERRAISEFASWLQVLAAQPSDAWRAPERAARLPGAARAALIELWLASGDTSTAAQLVASWCEGSEPLHELAQRLAVRARFGDAQRIGRTLALALERTRGAAAARAERLELLSGVAAPDKQIARAQAFVAAGTLAFDDWPIAGAIAGSPGSEALAELVAAHAVRVIAVERTLDAPWVDALARTLRDLRARDAEALVARIEQDLDTALRRSPKHPLRKARESGAWNALPGPEPISFEALDAGL
jgi:hypothetical protein